MKTIKNFLPARCILYAFLAFNFFILFTFNCFSQGVAINVTGSSADNSAILDLSSTTQGMLIPRMSTNERDLIIGTDGIAGHPPADGLQIYNTTTKCFEAYINGAWSIVSCPVACITPTAPEAAAASNVSCTSFQANMVMSVSGVTSYCFDVATDAGFTSFVAGYNNRIVNNTTICNVTGLTSNTTYYYRIRSLSVCYSASSNTISVTTILPLSSAPTTGTHVASQTQIVWNWNTVSGATGYKWGTTSTYSSATDMGTATTKTETGLTCNTSYTRYVWAYSTCGYYSTPIEITQTSSACWNCGSVLPVTHTYASGGPAPETKTVSYGTVTTNLSGAGKCWITQNLGSSNQATSATDATDAAAGWYWQFNRKQGYKIGPTPSWTITTISENSEWLQANDPCTIELGTGWRIPTNTELTNVDANGQTGGWDNYTEAYADVLKLHAAGYLVDATGSLNARGTDGYYLSSTQYSNTNSNTLHIYTDISAITSYSKAYGFSIRCIKDLPPFTCGNTLTDSRDSKTYSTVQIGDQCWMAQNMNYGTYVIVGSGQGGAGTQKYCKDMSNQNDASCPLGGIYEWAELMNGSSSCNGTGAPPNDKCSMPVQGICPDGWHIPSHYEWATLEQSVCAISPSGGDCSTNFPYDVSTMGWRGTTEGTKMKATTSWWSNTGTNISNFNVIAVGHSYGYFNAAGENGPFWTATGIDTDNAWHRNFNYNKSTADRDPCLKTYGFAVRCVKD
ncbi:MAG: hypothetical protein HGB12_02245 [Bacteroidetes bacterium]|nr:hypothetical protein [Bacteroidota bacterium]